MTANLTTLAPADIEINKTLDMPLEDAANYGYTPAQAEDSKLTVLETLEKLDFDVEKYFTDILTFNVYATDDITVEDTLGDAYAKVKEGYPNLVYHSAESFIKLSDYNKLAKIYHLEPISLKEDQYVLVADFDSWINIRNEGLKANAKITLLGKNYYPKYKECQNGFLYMTSSHVNIGFFVVPDDAVDESIRAESILIANYKANSEEEKEQIEQQVLNLNNHPYAENTSISASTKIAIYEGSVGLGALVTFIGLYLGIIFLISCAAILALKELSESSDNKERFAMLRKIGTDEKMINRALFRQIAIFFLFPLILAIIHSIFGIIFCNTLLSSFGSDQLLPSIIMTAIFIVIIYGGYFIITYFCSKSMIRERL